MANFPSFGLTLEEKSSLVVDVDALVAEAHDKLATTPHPTARDYDEALRILAGAEIMAKDCLEDDTDEDGEDEDDEYVSGPFSPSTTRGPRRRSLNQSLAEASVLRGDILRTQNKLPEARRAYNEAIARYPDDFPPPDAHAALTSSSSSRRPSLIPRPASSPAPSPSSFMMAADKRSVRRHRQPSPPPNAAKRAWRALMELEPSASDSAARRNSTPANNRTMSKRDKRRGGVWSAGIYEPSTPMAEPTEVEALLRQHREPSCAEYLEIREVGARRQVRIVEGADGSASDSSSASSGARSDRSIQYKKRCSDLRILAQEPRRKR
ncbi:hypothetical protein PG985_000338 [Apiospora marii]|uniref:Uncharacterized protein n=1 Tax=Apiospora marii TaxID=335849 RepID=A0ABR1R1Q0_9PEZI